MRESAASGLSHLDFGADSGRAARADGRRDRRVHGPLAVHIRCAAGRDDCRGDSGLLRAVPAAPVSGACVSSYPRSVAIDGAPWVGLRARFLAEAATHVSFSWSVGPRVLIYGTDP